MVRRRLTLAALALALSAVLAIPALAVAGTINTTGTIQGDFADVPPNPDALCNLVDPATPEEYRCDASSAGAVDLPTAIGTGTYVASMRFDRSIQATEPDCLQVTGTLVITTAGGTLTLTILPTSRSCLVFIIDVLALHMTVQSGTGAFAGTTGFLDASGLIAPGGSGSVMLLDAGGNIIAGTGATPTPTPTPTPTATPTPTPTPTPTGTAIPGAVATPTATGSAVTPAPTPLVALLPDAAVRPEGIDPRGFLLLAALLIVSAGSYVGLRTSWSRP
jgi:hypothetical protein